MKIRTFDELMLLPEGAAVERFFDGVNWRRFRWALGFALLGSLVVALDAADDEARRQLWIGAGNLAVLGGFYLLLRWRPVAERFTRAVTVLIGVEIGALAALVEQPETLAVWIAVGLPVVLLFLRLSPGKAFALCGVAAAAVLAWHLVADATLERASLWAFGLAIPGLLAASISVRLTRRSRQEFVDRWRRAVTRERERQRMRGELADARKIQLSMLPAGDPEVDWLELSGVCLPAVEVGGDYFDYIRLSDDAFALVMADVAGHGVASGLLIAGLRSSLYVLQDELRSPAAVLEKLNLMVRESVRHRTFVTVTVAVVERSEGRARVASAGHPPVLVWRAGTGAVREAGSEAPPLGTRLPTRYEEDVVDLDPGDLLLLYTDGLVEAVDFRTDAFGFDRLERALARAATAGTARDVRNDLLDSISRFKGETLQGDDLSLVVARYRGRAGPSPGHARGEDEAGSSQPRRAATG